MIGTVVIYSGKEYTVVDETPETLAVTDENGELHILPKASAIEKYGTGSKLPWWLIPLAIAGLAIL